jgi:hypothetical protein
MQQSCSFESAALTAHPLVDYSRTFFFCQQKCAEFPSGKGRVQLEFFSPIPDGSGFERHFQSF